MLAKRASSEQAALEVSQRSADTFSTWGGCMSKMIASTIAVLAALRMWTGEAKHLGIVVAAVLPSVRSQRVEQRGIPDASDGERPLRNGQPGCISTSAVRCGM